MRAFIHRHLSYANVMATIAVFVALGGSAFAASYVITKSSQIKDGAVTGSDVKNSSLTGADIKDRSLTSSDFDRSVQGPQGSQGPPGVAGPKGDTGPRGPSDLYSGYFGDESLGQQQLNVGIPLPDKGPYFVWANAWVENTTLSPQTIECSLNNGVPFIDETKMTVAAGDVVQVALMGTSVQSQTGSGFEPHVSLFCNGGGVAHDVDVGAIQVADAHT